LRQFGSHQLNKQVSVGVLRLLRNLSEQVLRQKVILKTMIVFS